MKRALITIALLAIVATAFAGIASAQGELTLEGLADALAALTGQVSSHEERIAALETRTAPTPTATPVPAPDTVLVVTIARGNVRAGPGTQHAIVGSVSQGEALEGPCQESGGWYQFCCTDDGENAWISATLVSVKQEGELTAWEEARNAAFESTGKI